MVRPLFRSKSKDMTVDAKTGAEFERSPRSPIGIYLTAPELKPQRTLEEAWRDAEAKFRKVAKRPLLDLDPKSKDGYLSLWASKCEVDDADDANKKRRILNVLSNILDGIDVVGGIVASGASLAFPPAGACFGVISFLIDIPRQIKKVYDTLLELFEEVEEFLVRFKILKRIDDRQKLGEELVDNASKMLLSFIDICILSVEILEEHRFSTAFKAALLKNDSGVGGALTHFRLLAKNLDSLTSTIAFEHVLVVEETVKDTSTTVKNVDAGVKTIVAFNQESKTERVNVDRLRDIDSKIFPSEEQGLWIELSQTTHFMKSCLPGTYELLDEHDEYKKWFSSSTRRSVLVLSGETGTGKSCMLAAVREKLELLQEMPSSDDGKVFVAFHAFRSRRTKAADKKTQAGSFIPFALRSMAVQIARQNTLYAKELADLLADKTCKPTHADDLQKLWRVLQFSNLKAPSASTLYLLFDGLEQESDLSISDLIEVLVAQGKKQIPHGIKIRIVLTGDSKIESRMMGSICRIDMGVLNKRLLHDFVGRELKRLDIFQDSSKKSVALLQKVVQGLDELGKNSFTDVRQRLERIQNAVQDDAPSSELDRIIADKGNQAQTGEATQRLNAVASGLKPVYISQVNTIITWIMYSQSGWAMEIKELEAILILEQNHDTLNSLAKKTELYFEELFEVFSDCLFLREGLEDALRESEDLLRDSVEQQKPLISMDISIKNVDQQAVQQFVSAMNAQMSNGTFDFRTCISLSANKIHANKVQGHLSIIRTCLKILNEGWTKETEVLLWYAREYLPKNLAALAEPYKENPKCISADELRMIGQGLVSFLNNPYELIQGPDEVFGSGQYWIAESECVEAIRLWLGEARAHLQAHERRWIDTALTSQSGKVGYMRNTALAVGWKWLNGTSGKSHVAIGLLMWLDTYLDNESESSDLKTTPDQSEKSDTVDNADTHGTIDAVSVTEIQESTDIDCSLVSGPLALSASSTNSMNPSSNIIASTTNAESGSVPSEHAEDQNANVLEAEHHVQRAVRWVEKNVNTLVKNGKFNLRVGYAYSDDGDHNIAIGYFEEAQKDPAFKMRALGGLARVKRDLGEKEQAIELFYQVLELMKISLSRKELNESDTELYLAFIEETTALLEDLKRNSEAISWFVQSLECKDDPQIRWKTLKLLCKERQESHAMELLEQWSQNHDSKSLAQNIFQSVDDDPFSDDFSSFLRVIKGEDLRNVIIDALRDAVQIASQASENHVKPQLLHLYGIAIATGLEKGRWQTATDLWDELLDIITPEKSTDSRYSYTLFDAARSAAGRKFSISRTKILADADMPKQEQDAILKRLQDDIVESTSGLNIKRLVRMDHPVCYAHALNVILGRRDDALKHTLADMKLALEVLSDDTPENDIVGITLLLRVFTFMGDRVDALSAFSLVDRKQRADKSDGSGTRKDPRTYDDNLSRDCDGCGRLMRSVHPDGFWCCQFCPEFDLCNSCHGQFIENELRLHLCDPAHEFIHFYHTEYSDEEIDKDKVRVDWEWVTLDDGGFARKGGEVVDLLVWVERLKKSWVLPLEKQEENTNE